jgi:hypothetical protein
VQFCIWESLENPRFLLSLKHHDEQDSSDCVGPCRGRCFGREVCGARRPWSWLEEEEIQEEEIQEEEVKNKVSGAFVFAFGGAFVFAFGGAFVNAFIFALGCALVDALRFVYALGCALGCDLDRGADKLMRFLF